MLPNFRKCHPLNKATQYGGSEEGGHVCGDLAIKKDNGRLALSGHHPQGIAVLPGACCGGW
jgi:hypothetical protein